MLRGNISGFYDSNVPVLITINTSFSFLKRVILRCLKFRRGVCDLLDTLRYECTRAVTKAVCHLQVEQGAACLGYLEQREFCANSRHTRVASKKEPRDINKETRERMEG